MFNSRTLVQLSLFSSLGLALLLFLSLIYSYSIQHELVVHRTLQAIPKTYIQVGQPGSEETIKFTIGLTSPNMTSLEKKLYEISNPNDTEYGKYLTKEEVEAFARPLNNVTTALTAWLSQYNVSPTNATPAGNRLSVEMTVSKAEKMFNATFESYYHISTNTTIFRTRQYSVPESLTRDIAFVYPTTQFLPQINNPPRRRTVPPSPSNTTKISRRDVCESQAVTVNCAMQLYHIPADMGVAPTKDETVVISFLGQTVQGKDVIEFIKEFRGDVPPSDIRLEIVSVDGGDNRQGVSSDTTEANVDVEMVVGINPHTRTTVATVNATPVSAFLQAFSFLLSQETMATVISMSYGGNEATDAGNQDMEQAVCNDIMQITARGTTVLVGSGDGGVSGIQSQSCTTFVPTFPSGCPYVLSVGATQVSPGGNAETAAFFSGGGFSNSFAIPPYQTEAVASYLNEIGPLYSGLYNTTGRGIPDIAVVGMSMEIVDGGKTGGVAGTSVSTPLAAGVIAAVNDHRRASGKGPVGFIHPWMYANTKAFTDITQGSNPGCNTTGFPAMKGWDPVTGLGTPLFDMLLTMP